MSEQGLKALEAELGTVPPRGLAALDDAQLRALAKAVKAAERRQAAELAAAGEQALQHIPKLLRVPIRRMFG